MELIKSNTQTMSSREIPEFLIKLSKQMNSDPKRMTAHPLWQVRTTEFIVTEQGYNEHHWEVIDDECGVVYRSDNGDLCELAKFLEDDYPDYFSGVIDDYRDGEEPDFDVSEIDEFVSAFDIDFEDLPDGLNRIYVQEVERVLSTHLTEADAEWFINRCSHHYSTKLYTYVESAYWAPELRELQDWIKSLTAEKPLETKE